MSLVAISGGVAIYFMLRSYLLGSEGPPLLRHIKGQRIFDRVLVAVSWRLARRLEESARHAALAAAAAAAGLRGACLRPAPLYARGIALGARTRRRS